MAQEGGWRVFIVSLSAHDILFWARISLKRVLSPDEAVASQNERGISSVWEVCS